MNPSNGDQLQNLLRKQAETLSKAAVQSHGRLSEEQVEALERLARVVEIRDKIKPPKTRKRWPVALILGITLLIVTLLLAVRVQKTEIELELALSEVQFELSKPVILADTMILSALGVSELREIQLPRARNLDGSSRSAQSLSWSGATGIALRLSVINDLKPRGTITLTALFLPAGTRVRISRTEISDQYRVLLEVSEQNRLHLQVSVKGTLQVALSGAPAEKLVYSIPRAIQMQAASNQVTLDLTLPTETQASFAPHLPVQALVFARTDQFVDTTGIYTRRVSTVLSGMLYFTDLNSREYPLRTGEGLQFKQSNGQMRILTMENGRLVLKFHGYVRKMTTGWEENRKNLMPSWLEWLSARHSLALLWVTTLFLFGLVDRVFKWWKG